MAFNATTGLGVAANIVVPDNTANYPGQFVLSLTGTTWPTTYQLTPQLVDASNAPVTSGTAFVIASVANASAGPFTLTAVAAATGTPGLGFAIYTGTITGGGTNAFAGHAFTITGFVNAGNNGTWQCSASSATTLTLQAPTAVAETHAGSASDLTTTAVYTGTITGGGTNAFAGQSFVVAGFVTTAANNGTFFATGSSATTLTLANPGALAETHAATATAQENSKFTYVCYGSSAGLATNGTQQTCLTVSATGLMTAAFKGESDVEISYPTFNNTLGNVASTGNIMNGLPVMKVFALINVAVLP